MSKYCVLLMISLFSIVIYAETKEKPIAECKDQNCAVDKVKQQPHPMPIHPCAPLEHCMPPSH